MKDPKLPQRKYKYARRTARVLFVVLTLSLSALVAVVNSVRVQQWFFDRYGAPVLAEYDLELDFNGVQYLFPSTVLIPEMQWHYKGAPLALTGALSFQEFVWDDQLLGRKVLLDGLRLDRAVDSALLAEFAVSFKASEPEDTAAFTWPIPLKIGELELQNITVEVFGHPLASSLNFSGLAADDGVTVGKSAIDLLWNTQRLRVQLDSTGYDIHKNVLRTHINLDAAGLATVDGQLHYQTDSVSSAGTVIAVSEPESEWLPESPYNELFSDAALEYQLSSALDLLLLEYSLFTSVVEGFGHVSYVPSASTLDLLTDFYPSPELYTRAPFKSLSPVFDQVAPEEIGLALQTDFNDHLEFDFSAIDGANSLRITADKFSEPARLTAELSDLSAGPLKAVSLRTALVPSIDAVLNNEPFSLRGVMPRLQLQNTAVKGLIFSYSHADIDSVYLSCLDPNLDFDGHLTLRNEQITSDLQLNAAGLYLFDPLDTGQILSAHLLTDLNFQGEGTVSLSNLLLQRPTDVVFLRNLTLNHSSSASSHLVSVDSDLLQASLKGRWEFNQLLDIGSHMLQEVLVQDQLPWQPADVRFQLDAGNISWLTDLLHIDAQLSEESHLYGSYNGPKKRWAFTADVPSLSVQDASTSHLKIKAYHIEESHALRGGFGQLIYQDYQMDTLFVDLTGKGRNRELNTFAIVHDSISTELEMGASYGPGLWKFTTGQFNIGTSQFAFIPGGFIDWNDEELRISNLGFQGTDGGLIADGNLLQVGNDAVVVRIEKLDSKVLNYLLRVPEFTLSGQLNGRVSVKNSLKNPEVFTMLDYQDIGVNAFTYGQLNLSGRYQKDGDLFAQGFLRNQGEALMNFGGHYDAQSTDIDVRVGLDALEISPLNPLLGGILDELEGQLQGGVSVYGPLEDWSISGSVALDRGHFTVPVIGAELATRYPAEITITDTEITLDSTQFYVPKDSTTAVAWGTIHHDRFDEIDFDLRFHADSMRAVDMERSLDGYFYGTAVAAGDMLLEGPLEQLHLDLAIATKDGTQFKIPLDNPTAVETPSFLRFIGEEQTDTVEIAKKSLEYFTTDIAIEATDEAKLELVLDEVLGDVIKAQGSGNLRLKLLEDESMELFGLYTVSSGSYLFTLQNIINKPFSLIPGGTILWSGDLYEAEVQLEAKYALSTDLEGLVSSASYNNENVPVDLIIELSGALMAPEIAFRVELPSSPASYAEELERHFLTEDAMNYQAFSLLMLGEFFKQDLGIQENFQLGSSVGKTTSELLVSEFGSWLAAGIGSYVDLELDYTSGDNPLNAVGATGDNLNLGVSKNFLDGRLRVNSSLDIPIAQSGASTLMLGDTEVAYALTKDGRIVLRAFNRSNRNDPLLQSTGPYTQGVGILFQKEFERVAK
jgi:hypothetical protein